ncbi:MAG: type IV pilus biogenesis/stability protein PilW [Pseudomonadota bacterium]
MTNQLKSIPSLLILCFLFSCASTGNKSETKEQRADINALVNNSLVYAQNGQLNLAEITIIKALEIDVNNVDANNIAGLIYSNTGENRLAVEYFEKALRLSPNDSSTLNNYANFLCNSGETKQAEQKFLQAATNPKNPNPEIAYTNAGLCMLRIPDILSAEEYFKTALDFQPNNSIALYQLAQIYLNQGRGRQALDNLRAYATFAKHTPETLKLGIEIGRYIRDKETEISYFNLLQNEFPASREYQWAVSTM